MDRNTIQKQIISHFWSNYFRDYVNNNNLVFTDQELLWIAWNSIPEYQERLHFLSLIAANIPSISHHAELCIGYMEASLKGFRQHTAQEVYELCIEDSGKPTERYLCNSYESALETIDNFWAQYSFSKETPATRYKINKRAVLQVGSPFREDELGYCTLGPQKTLLSVELYDLNCEYAPCSENCMECQKPLINAGHEIFLPFLPNLSLVKYLHNDGVVHYGITFEPNRDELSDCVFIVPLGGFIDEAWCDHEHLFPWNVDTASEDDLSDVQKADIASKRNHLLKWSSI